jgi:hypothetical protein
MVNRMHKKFSGAVWQFHTLCPRWGGGGVAKYYTGAANSIGLTCKERNKALEF